MFVAWSVDFRFQVIDEGRKGGNLNSKINSPDQTIILKTNNYNNSDSNSNCQLPKRGTEETSTPTRPVDNVVITTKGLQKNTSVGCDDSEK